MNTNPQNNPNLNINNIQPDKSNDFNQSNNFNQSNLNNNQDASNLDQNRNENIIKQGNITNPEEKKKKSGDKHIPQNINNLQDGNLKSDDNENRPLNNNLDNDNSEKPKVFNDLNDAEKDEKDENKEKTSEKFNPFISRRKIENKIQTQFKNIFRGNDYFENNYYRKRVMYLTIFCILIDILQLQILCLYFNCCFGEYIEMQRWISHTIAPMGVILLFIYIVIYFSADFISKKILQVFNMCLIIILILYMVFGIYTCVLASQQSESSDFIKNGWTLLSAYSKIYYYDNDIKILYQTYFLQMIITGCIYLFIFLCGFFLVIFIHIYTEKIDIIWRPPLRSKLRDERASRYINYYTMYNKEYKVLLEMHNNSNYNNDAKNRNDYENFNGINPNNENNNLIGIVNENYSGNKVNSQENPDLSKNKVYNKSIESENNHISKMKRENGENIPQIKEDNVRMNISETNKKLLNEEKINIDSNQVSAIPDVKNIKNSNDADNSINNNINVNDERTQILKKRNGPNLLNPLNLVGKSLKKRKNIPIGYKNERIDNIDG